MGHLLLISSLCFPQLHQSDNFRNPIHPIAKKKNQLESLPLGQLTRVLRERTHRNADCSSQSGCDHLQGCSAPSKSAPAVRCRGARSGQGEVSFSRRGRSDLTTVLQSLGSSRPRADIQPALRQYQIPGATIQGQRMHQPRHPPPSPIRWVGPLMSSLRLKLGL